MNTLQKRSLILSIILAFQYGAMIQFPNSIFVLMLSMPLTICIGLIYVFGLNIKKTELIDNLRFLILPALFNFGAVFFIRYMTQSIMAYVLVILAFLANFYLFIALKKVFNLEDRAAVFQRNIIISASFLSIFLSISAFYRFFVSYSADSKYKIPLIVIVIAVAGVFYLVSYFLAWENGIDLKKYWPYNLVTSLMAAEVAWVSSIWIVNYPTFSSYEKANLGGTPLPAVILVITFYFIWGVISHKASRTLTKNVMFEYILLTIIFLAVLFLSTKWLPQI
ncbi:MAG: hypothetical protein PHU86_02350 [Patescibacteria group bacterium]|nr:hypothetical protein [Patescibacteria group bacterium]